MFPELNEIKRIREKIGLSQIELATNVGITQSAIAKYEKGDQIPSYKVAKKIFSVLLEKEIQLDPVVKDLMTEEVITVKRTDTFEQAISKMKKHSLSQIPVVENRTVIGTVSESHALDLLNKYHDLSSIKNERLEEIMDEMLPAVPFTAKLSEITPLLKHYGAVLIIDKGKLSGIVTKTDLINF